MDKQRIVKQREHLGMNRTFKVGLRGLLLVLVLVLPCMTPAVKELPLSSVQAKTESEYVTSKSWITPVEIHDEAESSLIKRGVSAASYDGRTSGLITPVKDQGSYETCWSFSTAAAMEANLIKNGLAGADIDLSENAIAYFFYNRVTDALGYTQGDYNKISRAGYDYLSASGTLQGTGIALASGAGVLTEAQSPYVSIPSEGLCYSGDYVVRDLYLYNYNVSNLDHSISVIKQAVTDHGAVACGVYFSASYYNKDKSSYYCPVKYGNHAVAIVGWDDGYSKDNFVQNPGRDGAWIVKNSYGTGFGDNGYFYISYADKSLTECLSFEMGLRAQMYNNYYQHDGTGNPVYATNKGDWYANVFKAKGAGKNNEELKAVSVYTTNVGASYELQVYTGLSSQAKPTGGTKAYSSSVKGTLSDAGYHMIVLPEPVSLTAGEYFSVAVRLTAPSGGNAYIGVDSSYYDSVNDWIRFISATGKNQSFMKTNGKWYDIGFKNKANVRIKAFTDVTSGKSNFHLSTKELSVSRGDSQKLSLMAADYVHRKVTWKSADSKIASVNLKGSVKGKKYGATTITATFVNGSKKKTLKCKVTVGPTRMKGFRVSAEGKVKVSWKKNKDASGYEVWYATDPNGKFSKMAVVKSGAKTSCSKALEAGTYYVKMRPYAKSGKKKLFGSFTAAKEVVVP